MPNTLAYLMLILWPLVSLIMFRCLSLERAIIWTILGGYLILPQAAEFDLPLVPDMTKVSIPNICVLVFVVFYLGKPVPLIPASWSVRLLMAGFVLGVVPTVLTNGEPIVFTLLGQTEPIVFSTASLPGMGLRDLGSVVINQIIILLPFLVARRYLASEVALREILLALMIGGLIYTLPALIEIRLSPQINIWVYGFFQHDFEQMMRNGGFRPIVFLPHALWLAFFMMTAAMAAIALARAAPGPERVKYLAFALYLLIVLVLCKSLASIGYAALLAPFLLISNPRSQVRLALICAVVAIVYPMLRNNGWIPLDDILTYAEAISPDRAQSLGYRFGNEEQLLARADEKQLFGWGGWGRNLVRDPQSGNILTIPDGEWIIVFGTFGWVGYISQMGLLGAPLVLLRRRVNQRGQGQGRTAPVSRYAAAMAMLLAITLIDMLLNAILTPLTWLMAGAILGHCERLAAPLPDGLPDQGASKPLPRRTVMGRSEAGPKRSVL